MKKKILILATLLLVSLGYAGTKEDFQKAVDNYNNTQNIEALEKELKVLASKKSDEYTREAKFQLAKIAVSQNKIQDAKKYLNELLVDKELNNKVKATISFELYQIETDPKSKILALEKAISLDKEDIGLHILHIFENTKIGDTKKADTLYKSYTSKLSLRDKSLFDVELGEIYLNSEMFKEAEIYAARATKSEDNLVKARAFEILVYLEANKNNKEKALKYALETSRLTEGKIAVIESLVAKVYELNGNTSKALERYLKAKDLEKSPENYFTALVFAENNKNTKVADTLVKEMKVQFKDEAKIINYEIAILFLNLRNLELSEKYAKKSLTEDKEVAANIILSVIYANRSNKSEALKYLNAAKKAKITIDPEIEKAINDLK